MTGKKSKITPATAVTTNPNIARYINLPTTNILVNSNIVKITIVSIPDNSQNAPVELNFGQENLNTAI